MEKTILEFLAKFWDKNLASEIIFSPVPKKASGDLALNFFAITKKKSSPPQKIAQEISQILKNCPLIKKSEICGPYLNVFFKNEKFFEQVFETPTKSKLLKNKKILVEFSSPNTNKPLHLGHMRNHALGISLSRLFEKCGAKIFRVSIFNDRGIHICKSMLGYKKFGKNKNPDKKSDHFVGNFYVKFEQEAKKNKSLLDDAQKMLVDWEKNDPEIKKLWDKMNTWALNGYEETYARQGISFDKKYFESDLYKQGKNYVEEGLKKNILKKNKDGAIYIDLAEIGLDKKILLRANGTTVYITQDLHTTVKKQQDFDPDEQIWIVADEQNYHFKVLFFTLEKLNLLPANNLFHLGYGLVNLPEGRMKSREGKIIDADNLMNELQSLAIEKIKSRQLEISEKKIFEIAEKIQNAAWKFYLLKTSPQKTITFDTKKSIDFQGATGPYLQYAGVRINSILKKIDPKILKSPLNKKIIQTLSETEKPLGIKILEFPKILDKAANEKNPTYIVTYLLELCQTWSSFYDQNSILQTKPEELKIARIFLAKKIYQILEQGLYILGIEIPDKM